jgi:glycosyltransferase involved in cell wall biosynthesis
MIFSQQVYLTRGPMALPKVSIIIPAYNAEKTLTLCLESIKRLQYPQNLIEVILVDNNSTDRTKEISKHFDVFYVLEERQGRSEARNRGLSIASGKYAAFVDADVFLDEYWLIELINLFSNKHITGAQGQIIPSSTQGSPTLNNYRHWLSRTTTSGTFIITTIINNAFPMINSAACIYSTDVLKNIGGFDVNLVRHEDIDLSRRVLMHGHSLGTSERAIANVIYHGDGWWDYLQRAFAEGYFKVRYLKKWKNIKIVTPKSSISFLGLFGNFSIIKFAMLVINAGGRLLGLGAEVIFCKTPSIAAPKGIISWGLLYLANSKVVSQFNEKNNLTNLKLETL